MRTGEGRKRLRRRLEGIALPLAVGLLVGAVMGMLAGPEFLSSDMPMILAAWTVAYAFLSWRAGRAEGREPRKVPDGREAKRLEPNVSDAAVRGHAMPGVPAPSTAKDATQDMPDLPAASVGQAPRQQEPPEPTSKGAVAAEEGSLAKAPEAPPAKERPKTSKKEAAAPTSPSVPDPAQEFSLEALRMELLLAEDPLRLLRKRVRDVEGRGERDVSPLERFMARRLRESGLLLWEDDELPHTSVAFPSRSKTFYLRRPMPSVTYGDHLRLLRIEAALNATLFCHEHFADRTTYREEDLMRYEQRLLASVCAQVDDVSSADWSYLAMPWQAGIGPAEHGEWSAREGMAEAIESLQVPFRLEASFRANVAEGDIAIELDATPGSVFPRSALVDGIGVVSTTRQMREREASAYAARIGILLANCAFRASGKARRVWVAAIRTTPSRRDCLYSACFERKACTRLRMDAIRDPLAVLAGLGATMREEAGVLQPVPQGFYLEDERFCPPKRHDLWQMSERPLPASAALSLGASRISGLSIHEELPRVVAADQMLRELPRPEDARATELGVRSVLDVAHKTSDVSVWNAAERVASKLVDGSLGLDDPERIREELVSGDELSRAVAKAQALVEQEDPLAAMRCLEAALGAIDATDAYVDTACIAYRSFDTFASRALYNRLNASDRRSVELVPDAYLAAHLLAAHLLLVTHEDGGKTGVERALGHARRALAVAPLSTASHLCVTACLEQLGDAQGASDQLRALLEVAHDPQTIGFAYYRMAAQQWKLDNLAACQACYQRGIQLVPQLTPLVMAECHALALQGAEFDEDMDGDRMDEVMRDARIPIAPTNRISYLIYDCATASVDAEVFPLARDLTRILELFTGDDVVRGIRNSLEREPDA